MNLGKHLADCIIQEGIPKYEVYFDVDNTLTDYFGQLKKLNLSPNDTVKEEHKDFWTTIKWLPGSINLLEFSQQHFPTKLLTVTPDFESVKQGKQEWIKENIGNIETIMVERGKDKSKYATPNSILIDDNKSNITAFEQAGGIGILFKHNPEEVLQELKKYWDPFYIKEDKIPGGLTDNKTLLDIAEKYNIEVDDLIPQFRKGIKVEKEHTSDPEIAEEIAMDHLWEDPKYYDKLEKIETNESLNTPKFTSDFKKYISYINELVNYVCEDLQIERPEIKIINGTDYTQQNHSFGGYQPGENKIFLVIKGRNCSDVCRTLSHELKHAQQDQQGVLTPESGKDGSEHENECNSYAGKVMREFNRKYPEILTLIN